MTRATIRRVRDPVLRALYRSLHAAPKGRKAARQRELVLGVAKMLSKESA